MTENRVEFHWPMFYRYKVANPGFYLRRNKYPGAWIGLHLNIGHYGYCIKWGWARVVT